MFDILPFGQRQKDLFSYLDNFDKDFFGDTSGFISTFRSDILDKGDKYVLQAELPGFDKEDINIDIDGDFLTISAEHNEEKEESDKDKNYVRRERKYGSFSRRFDISNIKHDEISAEYKNGILELDLPKQNPNLPKEPRKIEIK